MASVSFGDGNSGFQAGTVNGMVNIHHHAPPERQETTPGPSILVPFSRDVDFVKRGIILDQIHQKFTVLGSRVAIVGLGGVGKSQLAIEYAYRVRELSPNTWVFWVHASNAARFEQSFRDIAQCVKIPGRQDPQANIFQLVHDWLHNDKNGKWVLILDNVDDASFIVETQSTSQDGMNRGNLKLLESYLPQTSNGSILISTRSKHEALRLVESRNIVEIEPMNKSDALALLEKKLGLHPNDDAAVELVEALEFMPLAIVQAAAFISHRQPRYSVRKYLKDFRESDQNRAGLLNHEGEQLRRDREAKNSIIITWQLSFDHIRRIKPSAADLLSLMSFFDRQGIPETVLRSYNPETSPTFPPKEFSLPGNGNAEAPSKTGTQEEPGSDDSSSPEASGDLDSEQEIIDENWSECGDVGNSDNDQSDTDDSLSDLSDYYSSDRELEEDIEQDMATLAVNEHFESDIVTLRDYSFISCTVDPGIFNMHRLVQLSTQRWLEADGQLNRWRTQFIENLCMQFPPPESPDWAECQILYPHATSAAAQQPNDDHSLLVWASLLHKTAWYASKEGNLRGAMTMCKKAIRVRERLLGKEHNETLRSLEMLGSVLYDDRRFTEAEKYQRRVIDARQRVLGIGHPLTLASKGNLASTIFSQRRLEEAEALEDQVVEHYKSNFGATHLTTLNSMGFLALIYIKQGRFGVAEDLIHQVLDAKEKLGVDDEDTLNVRSYLALTYRMQGRFEVAKRLYLQILEVYKKKFRADNLYTLNTKSHLAITYWSQGQFKDAEELEVQVLEARRKKLGEHHLDTLDAKINLALTYKSQGQFKDAGELEVQVLETRRKKLGKHHLDTLDAKINLASTYWS